MTDRLDILSANDASPGVTGEAGVPSVDEVSCHSDRAAVREAAKAAGSGETLERYARDYPVGPHDQPQSMCPAFGALRVGLRMRRTASVLCGSACCVYGLTFTSHFYGAQADGRLRAVQLRDPGHRQAVRGHPRRGLLARRSRPLRHDRRHQSLRPDAPRACRSGSCPRRSTACGSSASTCRGSACPPTPRPRTCSPARCCASPASRRSRAPSRRRARPRSEKPSVTLLGEMFPVDPVQIGAMLDLMGLSAGPVVPTREWRELYGALDCAAVAADASVLHRLGARVRTRRPSGRRLGAGRRRRNGGLARSDRRGLRRRRRPDRRRQGEAPARDRGPRSPRTRSPAASTSPATRALNSSSRA